MVSRNLMFNWLQKTSDHGAINSWDRLPYITNVGNGTDSLIPAWWHVHQNFLFGGGEAPIDTDDGSNRLNVTENVVLQGGLYKDGIANSHKRYAGNVELFGENCFNSGQWDRGSSNFTDNHCFGTPPSSFDCHCNATSRQPPCPELARNHYYQHNQTYSVCGKTLTQLATEGIEVNSTVQPVPTANEIVQIIRATLGMGSVSAMQAQGAQIWI